LKNFIKIIYNLLVLFGGLNAMYAQTTPPGIPYQAIARNANGTPYVNANLIVRFSLHEQTATGTVSYAETKSLQTNDLGLFSTTFGSGTPITGTFAGINWAQTTKFLQVEINLGSAWVDMGTQQLMSVPYAMYSLLSGSSSSVPNNVVVFETPNTPGTYTNWIVPAGVTKIQVECWGAGGSGGQNCVGINNCGSGVGGGGAYVKSFLTVVPGSVHQIEVGSGSSSILKTGGLSRFDSLVIAYGGNATPYGGYYFNLTASGGTGIGQIVYNGQDGFLTWYNPGTTPMTLSAGGYSPFGGFGADSYGRNANTPGGGGSGGVGGGNGRVFITY
jgi:hypothetical protein